jgi:hypothetical protein
MYILGTVLKILSYPVTGPVDGFLALVKTIKKRAEEAQKKMSPKARLMELESKLAVGEITPEEYQEQEDQILKEIEEQLDQEG